ncbi:MAG: hypothetical protein BWY61_01800 [Firmicutes bacterium ADurb.Bin354]|nr:MAG: hypothetical protein BWY61_01800 [Firmicutes bacterium ADurb.Bin354]
MPAVLSVQVILENRISKYIITRITHREIISRISLQHLLQLSGILHVRQLYFFAGNLLAGNSKDDILRVESSAENSSSDCLCDSRDIKEVTVIISTRGCADLRCIGKYYLALTVLQDLSDTDHVGTYIDCQKLVGHPCCSPFIFYRNIPNLFIA